MDRRYEQVMEMSKKLETRMDALNEAIQGFRVCWDITHLLCNQSMSVLQSSDVSQFCNQVMIVNSVIK